MSEILVPPATPETQSAPGSAAAEHPLLQKAREGARQQRTPFAGSLAAHDAWVLVGQQLAVLVDVRSAEELKFVGQVPGSRNVPWATGLYLNRNPRFVKDLEKIVARDQVVILLCRSGKRSAAAAQEATRAGFLHAFNVLEGFEGERNERQQRGALGGWRHSGLPWVQD